VLVQTALRPALLLFLHLTKPVLRISELPVSEADADVARQPAAAVLRRVWRAALEVIEIEEHRRAVRRRTKHRPEIAEDVRADRIALVLGQVLPDLALADEDVEVVEPEVDQ